MFMGVGWQKLSGCILAHNTLFKEMVEESTPGVTEMEIFNPRKRVGRSQSCLCVSAQSCPTLHDPMDWGPPGSSVQGVFQATIPEWAAIAYSRDLPEAGVRPVCLEPPALAGGFFTTSTTWEAPKLSLDI